MSESAQNTPKNEGQKKPFNKDGKKFFYRSVHFIPGERLWKVQVKFRGRIENVGLFPTEKEAHEVWLKHYAEMESRYEKYMKDKHGKASIAGKIIEAQHEQEQKAA